MSQNHDISRVKGLHARQRGATLVGILAIFFGISLSLAAMAAWNQRVTEQRKALATRSVRDRIALEVKSKAEMSSAIWESSEITTVPGNVELKKCLDPAGAVDCVVTNPNRPMAFRLEAPYSSDGLKSAVAGTTSDPVRYTSSGRQDNCTASSKCPYEAYTYFWASCPGGAASCQAGYTINVRRRIRVADGVQLEDGPRPGPTPSDSNWEDPTFETAALLRSEIKNESDGCGIGAYITTVTSGTMSGDIECACAAGFREKAARDSYGRVQCEPIADLCPPRYVFLGITDNNTPNCLAPPTTTTCVRENISDVSGRARCNANEWKMRELTMTTDCYESGHIVICPDTWMTCCLTE